MLRRIGRDTLVNGLLASPLVISKLRLVLMRRLGFDLGAGVRIESGCWFSSTDVSIGADSFLNFGCFVEASSPVRIGARCDLGMQVMLCSVTHESGDSARRAGPGISHPITIGDGCWLGARVTVLPGVTVGEGCVIAAGATVTRGCEPHGLYGGVPAVRLRDLA